MDMRVELTEINLTAVQAYSAFMKETMMETDSSLACEITIDSDGEINASFSD